ncbi:MAG: hypothetical protein GY810_18405 [Aureispira sp.]|nr:hypothetical protein [Aureispira sp.]
MILRLSILVLVFALTACSSTKDNTKTVTTTTTNPTPTKITYKPNQDVSMDQFLQDAITSGLQRDAITTKVATGIADIDRYFVEKCNICKNVRKALRAHTGYTDASKMTGEFQSALKIIEEDANHSEAGKDAFKTLVNSYVKYHFRHSNLMASQTAAIQKQIEIEAENGKALMSMYSFCPSCDGADGACKKE